MTISSNGSVTYKNSIADENDTYAFAVVATYSEPVSLGFLWLVTTRQLNCTGDGSSITGAFDGLVPICEGIDYNYAFIFYRFDDFYNLPSTFQSS